MLVTPTMKYAGITRGIQYRLLDEGRDYKKISVMGRPMYVPSFVFDANNFEIEEEDEG